VRTGRKQQILEVLASELEAKPGSRITTAGLAATLGVSEAALYRHFPSKAKMFDGLIDFAEQSVFGLVNRILEEERDGLQRCAQVCRVVLVFAERNPGITRVLMGDILMGEHERLRARTHQFFDRLETQLRQILREASVGEGPQVERADLHAAAALFTATLTGRMAQFVRSNYRISPHEGWPRQWEMLARATFAAPSGGP
jgi:TetR/AcrR family transcriptional regulator